MKLRTRLRFPQSLYRLIPSLYPHFAEILKTADITTSELLTLSYVKHRGQDIGPQGMALPIKTLMSMLVKVGMYQSDSGAHGFITSHLENRAGYLRHHTITPAEKDHFFPGAKGYRDVVVLTEKGHEKLNDVNREVEKLFDNVVGKGIPPLVLKTVLVALDNAADHVVGRLDQLAKDKEDR